MCYIHPGHTHHDVLFIDGDVGGDGPRPRALLQVPDSTQYKPETPVVAERPGLSEARAGQG